jgi:hypothetical protein
MRDAAPHRQVAAAVYNAYSPVSGEPAFSGRQGDDRRGNGSRLCGANAAPRPGQEDANKYDGTIG